MKRQKDQPKRIKARTNEELYNLVQPEYYFEGAFRKVRPYYFEYQTYAKARWLGRTILDVFVKEFRDRPARYYQEAIDRHLITINGEPCTLDQQVEDSDLIGHKLHRHEPPVTSNPIKILHNQDELLVVDKPSSIPAHPSGRYRFNTLVEILKRDHNFSHISVINRLDRLTSGICILATSSIVAERLHQQMEERGFQKEYIARVVGEFPKHAECQEPLKVVEHKLGLVSVNRKEGKPSHTMFELLSTNGKESIVKCRPLTGRTHQIRVHLKSLGYPITNDHLYNNSIWPADNVEPDPSEIKKIANFLMNETISLEGEAVEVAFSDSDQVILCPECLLIRPDPTPEQMCIYLHAFKYSCDKWSFQTDLPSWSELSS